MPGKMTSRRIIGVAGSVVLILVLLLILTDPWSTVRNEGKQIALKHSELTDRIVVADRSDSTVLVKEAGGWTLPGEGEVNDVSVENLLFAASRMQVNSILDEAGAAEAEQGRSIRFFAGNRQQLAYRLFSRDGRYLVRPEGSSRAYFVSVTGYQELDLLRVFSSSPNHYRQHILIDLMPSEIASIRVERTGNGAFEFSQDREGELGWQLPDEPGTVPEGPPDELAVRLLFSYFTAIRYEEKSGIGSGELLRDQEKYPRLAQLEVTARDGTSHTLRIFPHYPSGSAEPDMFKALVLFDGEPEALVVNYIYLDVLMRDLSHYF